MHWQNCAAKFYTFSLFGFKPAQLMSKARLLNIDFHSFERHFHTVKYLAIIVNQGSAIYSQWVDLTRHAKSSGPKHTS